MIESIPPEIAGKFRAGAAASPDNSLVVDADFVAAVLMAGADEETIDQTLTDLVPQPFDYYTHRVDTRPFTRMTCPRYVLLAADDASLPRAAWLGGMPDQDHRPGLPVECRDQGIFVVGEGDACAVG